MRSSKEIFELILTKAKSDERIRAVLLNGSRANPNVKPDQYQDFDIVYIVSDIESFKTDENWVDYFGEILIKQLPDQMSIGETDPVSFAYLMLFKDGNRIDLTLFPQDKLQAAFKKDSLTSVILDKDNLFQNNLSPTNKDYLIKKPGQKEFTDVCNEFWWVSTYVAKGLARNQMIYTKYMLEGPVRLMFLKMVEWAIGIEKDFNVDVGMAGKYIKDHVSPILYSKILRTYADSGVENNWNALFLMTEIFSDLAQRVSGALSLQYDSIEEANTLSWLTKIRSSEIQ
jgi:aminoglycoside 6-adenylyltransferase